MKEIKYRAFDKKGRFDMADVLIVDFKDRYVIVDATWNEDPETGEADCVADFDEIELVQYTGLKDKNGKEIYEGDIVKEPDDFNGKGSRGTATLVTIESYGVHPFSMEDSIDGRESTVEVIGNIYENSELLNPTTSKEITKEQKK